MGELSDLSPVELSAAMRGGTVAWGQYGSALDHVRYSLPIPKGDRRRSNCSCGCKKRETHRGFANGVCLMSGCEFRVARWVKDPASVYRRAALRNHEASE